MTAMEERRSILVTGATGRQGGAVARHLLADGRWAVRALTRDPAKPAARALADRGAEVIEGDLNEPATLERALVGAYGVFSVQNYWEAGYEGEVRQGRALADAARAADVRHFVYSSVGSADRETGIAHFESKWEVEKHIHALDLPRTIFRPVFFMQNWEVPTVRESILSGTLAGPLDRDRPLQQLAVDDIGAFAAMAFADPDAWIGRELDLAGDERTMPEIAAAFARAIGRPVEYVQVPWARFGEAVGEDLVVMYRWFNDVGYDADIDRLRALYPSLTDFGRYLERGDWAAAELGADE